MILEINVNSIKIIYKHPHKHFSESHQIVPNFALGGSRFGVEGGCMSLLRVGGRKRAQESF